MAKIGKLGPNVDFYYWKGCPVVRMMPKKVRQPGTPTQQRTWTAMSDANFAWNGLDEEAHNAWRRLSRQSHMSARDLCLKVALTCNYANKNSFNPYWLEWDNIGDEECGAWLWVLENDYNSSGVFTRTCFLNEEERKNLFIWQAINPSLRGKKIRRRWKLINRANTCHRTYRRNVYVKGYNDRYVTCYKANGDLYLYMEQTGHYQPPGGFSGVFKVPYL